MLTLVPPLNF